jgi:uncharacterized membrane protein
MGFVTSDQPADLGPDPEQKTLSVFVPTTPNPTGGFLLLLPETKVTKLDMSVADGIKFIISLGAIAPEATESPTHLAPDSLKPVEPRPEDGL